VAWTNFLNLHYNRPVHQWEFFHYYLGGKYFAELGYTRLYACAAAVDREDGLTLEASMIRDLRDDQVRPIELLGDRLDECRSRFSEARWQAFARDARFFRSIMGRDYWMGARRDHGFNPGPAWLVVGGTLAALRPASWSTIGLLAALDPLLVLACVVLLWRTFGWTAATVAASFFGLNALSSFAWTGGAYLRYDWLLALVGAVVALRTGRPGWAGFALGYATLVRVFPVFAVLGVALHALVSCRRARSLGPLRSQWPFAAGLVAAVVVFGGLAVAKARDPRVWVHFAENAVKHSRADAANLTGLGVFLRYSPETRLELMLDPMLPEPAASWYAHRAESGSRVRLPQLVAAGSHLLLLVLAVRGQPPWVAALLGTGFVPIVLQLSCYYAVYLMAMAALCTVTPWAALALALFTWASTVAEAFWHNPDQRFAWLSLALVILVVALAGLVAASRRTDAPDPASGNR
jgi:hypothetical protein